MWSKCIASKRFIVVKKVANEFIEKFVEKTERLKVGDPMHDDTDLGPVVNSDGLEKLHSRYRIQSKRVQRLSQAEIKRMEKDIIISLRF